MLVGISVVSPSTSTIDKTTAEQAINDLAGVPTDNSLP
jgi:hypothetical protein